MNHSILLITLIMYLDTLCMDPIIWTNTPEKHFIVLDNKWEINREYMNSVLSSTNSYFEKTKIPHQIGNDQTIIHFFASCTKDYHEEMLNLLVTEKVTNMKHIQQMTAACPHARKVVLGNLRMCECIESYRNTNMLKDK